MVLVAPDQTGSRGAKPFLGGWRRKATGTVYCNACTQTARSGRVTSDRNSQTDSFADKCTDTRRHVAVQVDSFPDARDRLMAAGKPSQDPRFKEPSNEKIAESVVKIQRFYRWSNGRCQVKAVSKLEGESHFFGYRFSVDVFHILLPLGSDNEAVVGDSLQ